MAYLDECRATSHAGASKSLEEIKKLYYTEGLAPESKLEEEASPKGTTS